MEVNNLEVEEELSTMATHAWAEEGWLGKWRKGQQKAWRKQIFEVRTWKAVRGLARTDICETGDLGIKWTQWHTLLFERQVSVDIGWFARRTKNASEASQDGPLNEMGSKARV